MDTCKIRIGHQVVLVVTLVSRLCKFMYNSDL
jgi:hypothetical protein